MGVFMPRTRDKSTKIVGFAGPPPSCRRTAVGKFGGSLAGVPAFALGATVIKQLLEAPEKPWTESDVELNGVPDVFYVSETGRWM